MLNVSSNCYIEFNLINNYISDNKEYIKSEIQRYTDYFIKYKNDQGIECHFSAYIKDTTPGSSLRYGDLTENWLQLKPSQKESILNQVQSLASHTLSNYNRASCSSFSGQNSSASRQHKPVLDNSIIIKQYRSGTKNLQDVLKCTVSLITKPTANYQDAIRLLNNLTDAGITPNVITYNAVISACEKGGKAEEALEIFKAIPVGITLDVITYTAVISACGKGGKAEKALEIFNKMLDAGITPNVITYNAVISACGKGGKAEKALEIFKAIPVGIPLNVIIYNAVISACEKGGKAEEALEIFNKMPDAGITPNVITYNAVISACEKGGKAEKALEIFNKMYSKGLIRKLSRNTLNLHYKSFYTYPIKGGDGMSGIHPSVAKVAIQFFMDRNKRSNITVITGFNSGSALKDSILESFKDRVKELPNNPGRLIISGELV